MHRPPDRRRFHPSTQDWQLVDKGPVQERHDEGQAAIV